MGSASTAKTAAPLHTIEIDQRPQKTWAQLLHGVAFIVFFLSGCITMNATQVFFLLPLKLVPGDWAKRVYEEGVRETKGAFGKFIGAQYRPGLVQGIIG